MKKKLLSLVCALALTISLLPAAQALEGEGTRAAEALASLGLVTGTGAGYAAEKPATQEQAAALLVRLLGAEKTAKADRRSCGWAGIPSWARSAVNYCAFHDLIDWSEYRAGGALDAELWCAMLLRALGCGSELGSSAARTARRIGLISRPLEGTLTRGDLFVAELDGPVAAAAVLNRIQVDVYAGAPWEFEAPDEEIFVMHTLVVDPAAGGHGLGRAFETFYEQEAARQGCRYLRIDTNVRNTRARRLYHSLGYKEISVAPCTFNGLSDIDLVLLEKAL